GLRHCEQLAIADRFSVETVQADLTHYELGQREFDLVTMIYYLDIMLFSAIALALRPGGHFLFHTFGRDQARRDWGPSNPNFLACGRQVLSAFDDWQIRHFAENDVERSDGRIESVVQMLARKPGLA
ncbi:uncharacterized protein METZ01_LOCUS279112, partial [marine metagenome]